LGLVLDNQETDFETPLYCTTLKKKIFCSFFLQVRAQ